MKRIGLLTVVLAMVCILAGCRGNKSTYTTPTTAATTAMTTAMTTQATTENTATQTPTINNGNGPVTTAAPDDNSTDNTVDSTMDNTMASAAQNN